MAQRLLAGLRVVDLGGEPAARAARVLGDLGAIVARVVPPAGDGLRPDIARAWNVGKQVVALAADDAGSTRCSRRPTSCSTRPARPGTHELDPARAPRRSG